MDAFRITKVLHPNVLDSSQGLIWARANYCEGECFPWLLLTPTQLVLLARAGRITLLALLEISAEDIAAITGCAAETAAELARRIADDGAYWAGQAYLDESERLRAASGGPPTEPVDLDRWRRERPEYRTPSPIALLPQPGPPFPWPKGDAWNRHMAGLIVGQFEDGGHEIRNLLQRPAADVPGRTAYLTDPHVIASYEARRGELKRDLERVAEDAKTYELARWLVQELSGELRDIENYLDRWLPAHRTP